jgi:aspartate aminotransferase
MLSPKIENIAVSGTMEIAAKIIEMKSNGIEVFDLCAGESDFPTPDHVKIAAQNAISENKTRYTINSGIIELRRAICDKFLKEYGAEYSPNEVIVSNGAKQAVYNSLQDMVSDGDEVILAKPYFVSYPHMIKLTGATPKIVTTKTENSYKLTAEEFLENITKNTKAVIICNPNNPSGAVYTREELNDIIEIAYEKNIMIIADEIYEKLIYDSAVFTSFASFGEKYKNNLIIINGVSKAYSMTGWRIGYAVSTKEVIVGMNKLQSHSTSNACTVSQYAALAALTGPQDVVEKQRKIFEDRRNIVHEALTKIDSVQFIEPHGAFYFFVNITELLKHTTIKDSKDFCIKLLDEGHVGTVPGSVFGMEGYIRIAYTKSKEELLGAMKRLTETVENFMQVV